MVAGEDPTADVESGLFFNLCAPLSTCKAFCGEFHRHTSRLRMCGASQENAYWPYIFGTSPWFDEASPALLCFRGALALIFVGHLIYHFSINWQEGFWFIYLTHWSFLLETLYLCIATYTAYDARARIIAGTCRPQQEDGVETKEVSLPLHVRLTWVLQHVAMPASVLVFFLYWTLENPIWDLSHMPDYMGFFVHGINFVLLVMDLLIGRNVFYWKHTVFFLAYASIYLIWTVIHHVAKVGTHGGCDSYVWYECPVYDAINWHDPAAAGIYVVLILIVVVPLCQYPLWWCVHKRRITDSYLSQTADATKNADGKAPPAEKMGAELPGPTILNPSVQAVTPKMRAELSDHMTM